VDLVESTGSDNGTQALLLVLAGFIDLVPLNRLRSGFG
jgi:hypothetical protein